MITPCSDRYRFALWNYPRIETALIVPPVLQISASRSKIHYTHEFDTEGFDGFLQLLSFA